MAKELVEGCRVRLRYNHEQTGKIIKLGPEVSEVKWEGKTFHATGYYHPNDHLERIEK